MHIYHWHFTLGSLFWASLAFLGFLAVVAIEALSFRLLVGKW